MNKCILGQVDKEPEPIIELWFQNYCRRNDLLKEDIQELIRPISDSDTLLKKRLILKIDFALHNEPYWIYNEIPGSIGSALQYIIKNGVQGLQTILNAIS